MGNIKNLSRKSIFFLTLFCAWLLGAPLLSAAAQGSFGYHGATLEVAWRGEQALRDLARERESISHLISATKVEMKRVLRTTFPELESVGDLFTRSMLRFLKEYPSARRMKMAKLKNLAKVLNQPQVGNKLSFSVEDILRAAQSSVATAYKLIRVIFAMLSHRTYFQAKMA